MAAEVFEMVVSLLLSGCYGVVWLPGCCYSTAKSEWLLCILVAARVLFGCQGVAMRLLLPSEWSLAHCQWLLCFSGY